MSTLPRAIGDMIISTPTSHGMAQAGPTTGDGTLPGIGTAGMTPIGHGAGVPPGVGDQAGHGDPHGARRGAGGLHGAGAARYGVARRGAATDPLIDPEYVRAHPSTIARQEPSAPADVPALLTADVPEPTATTVLQV